MRHYLLYISLFVVLFTQPSLGQLAIDDPLDWLDGLSMEDSKFVDFIRAQNREANELFFNKDNKTYQDFLLVDSTREASLVSTEVVAETTVRFYDFGRGARIEFEDADGNIQTLTKRNLGLDDAGIGSKQVVKNLGPDIRKPDES